MKRFGIFLLALALFLCLIMSVSATSFDTTTCVIDLDSRFTATEVLTLELACREAEARTGIPFLIVTTADTLWGEDVLWMYSLPENADRVILILTSDYGTYTYYYDLYTYGKAASKLSDREVDIVLDHPEVYDNLKGGNLSEGCLAFLDVCSDKILTPNLAPSNFSGSFLLRTVFMAAAFSFAICLAVYASYKKKKKSASYPLDVYTNLNLTDSKDIFLGSFVSKRRISSSSSGGGRSGGFGGGGGGGRGGGGGHRGGR